MKRLDAIIKHDMLSVYDSRRPWVVYRQFYYHFDLAPVLGFWKLVLGLKREPGADTNSVLQDFSVRNTWTHFT